MTLDFSFYFKQKTAYESRISDCSADVCSSDLAVLGSLLMVWLVLTGFDAVSQLLRQLGNIGKHGYTLSNAIVYVLMTFPRRAYEMFGNAALIGGLDRESGGLGKSVSVRVD